MNFRRLFDFLRELNAEGNNNKEWMDTHRNYYHETRDDFIAFLEEVDNTLGEIDTNYSPTIVRKSIMRINNNRMFHPDKPIYKDHFAALLDVNDSKADFFMTLGLQESFIATGFYKPEKELLNKIRQEIDYSDDEFKTIIEEAISERAFDGLMEQDKLKRPPKGYEPDHSMIEFIKNKSFVLQRNLTQKQIIEGDFKEIIIESYLASKPFRNFLNRAKVEVLEM